MTGLNFLNFYSHISLPLIDVLTVLTKAEIEIGLVLRRLDDLEEELCYHQGRSVVE